MTVYKGKNYLLVGPNCNQVSPGTLKRDGAMLVPGVNRILRWCWDWNNERIINLKPRFIKGSSLFIITCPIECWGSFFLVILFCFVLFFRQGLL